MWLMDMTPSKKKSDRKFIEDLYQTHKNLMFSLAWRYADMEADAEDIVQSAAEKLLRQVVRLKAMEEKAVTAYVAYTVRSVGVDLRRSRSRYEARFVSLEQEDYTPWDIDPLAVLPEEHAVTKDLTARLIAVWPQLPEEDQLLLEGRYVWELSDRDLALRFNCKPGSIRMKLTRARRKALHLLVGKEEVQA